MVHAISIEGVSKSFKSGAADEVRALEPVSQEIDAGEFFSLIGPSGCGKTTLLRMLAGLLQPSSGRIRIGGELVARPNPRVSILFQKPTLLPWRSVLENCLLPMEIMRLPRREVTERADALLEMMGLQSFRRRFPAELSGGMQQRVAIARALVSDPDVLLMDEPFNALDEFTRERLQEELLRLRATRPKTVVFVTHHIGEAVFLSDRIGVMAPRPGRLGAVIDLASLPVPRTAALRKSPEYFAKMAETRAAFEYLLPRSDNDPRPEGGPV